MTMYDRIKRLRLEQDMSQEELAKKVGYKGRSMIARIEAGEVDISQSKVKAFAQALNTSIDYLMDGKTPLNDFQYRLQKLFSESNATQRALAIESGIDRTNLENYLNGTYIATPENAAKLANAFGVDPNWLLTGEHPSSKADPEEFSLLSAWRSADDLTKAMVRRMLRMKEPGGENE